MNLKEQLDQLKEYPKGLEECLDLLKQFQYRSFGFGGMYLLVDKEDKWHLFFRNPADFKNPDIMEDSPVAACHKMLDFVKTKL